MKRAALLLALLAPAFGQTTVTGAGAVINQTNVFTGPQYFNAPAAPQSGLIADLRAYVNNTGTVLVDSSGNGNNCTFAAGGNAPTWGAHSIEFSGAQYCDLPAALNSVSTVVIAYREDPAPGNAIPGFPTLMGGSGASGLALTTQQGGGGLTLLNLTGPANITRNSNLANGYHIAAYIINTSDQLFLDGVETAYLSQSTSVGVMNTGHFQLGGATNGAANYQFNGGIYALLAYNRVLSSAEVLQATSALYNVVYQYGIGMTAVVGYGQNNNPNDVLMCRGDSITYASGLTSFCASAAWPDGFTPNRYNHGIPGIGIFASMGLIPSADKPLVTPQNRQDIATILLGTNGNTVTGAPQQFRYLCSLVQQEAQAGYTVLWATIPSKTGANCGDGQTCDAMKDTFDQLIHDHYNECATPGKVFLMDFASDPRYGADGANANSTYFQVDGIHPTQTLQTIMGNMLAANVLRTRPAAVTLTAASPTITVGQTPITCNPNSNTVAMTLPDAIGITDYQITITNSQLAGSNLCKVTTTNSETISGNGFSVSTYVIPNGQSITLKAVSNSYTVGGANWAIVNTNGPVPTTLTASGVVTFTGTAGSEQYVSSIKIPAGSLTTTQDSPGSRFHAHVEVSSVFTVASDSATFFISIGPNASLTSISHVAQLASGSLSAATRPVTINLDCNVTGASAQQCDATLAMNGGTVALGSLTGAVSNTADLYVILSVNQLTAADSTKWMKGTVEIK